VLCLFVCDIALPALVAAGAAVPMPMRTVAHFIAMYDPWLHVAQLKDVQAAFSFELIACDDVGVARHEVNGGSCYPSRDHGGRNACGDEGWDGDDHGAFSLLDEEGVAVVDLLEEDKLARECL
jgi:hypothetical protein